MSTVAVTLLAIAAVGYAVVGAGLLREGRAVFGAVEIVASICTALAAWFLARSRRTH